MVAAPSARAAEVGVRNDEQARVTFHVRVLAPAPAGGPPLLDRTISLDQSKAATWTITLPPTAGPVRVSGELYRVGSPAPYRRAHVWTLPGG
jgi:hypothetical protein